MLDIFKAYEFNKKKAISFGFIEENGIFKFSSLILEDDFQLIVSIVDKEISFHVFDQETGDLYPQVHMESMRGSFVGAVREACLEVLYQIRKSCFDVQDFICPQTERVMAIVQEKYGNQLEYLWEKSPDTAVLRHVSNQKWYAVLMKISWEKLDRAREDLVEVINVKHDQVVSLLQEKGIYPAFHMNKRYWISVPLDESLSDQQILDLIERSWDLTRKKK